MLWYIVFCMGHGLTSPLPAAGQTAAQSAFFICSFLLWKARAGLSYSTLKVYLCGVRNMFLELDIPSPTDHHFVRSTMKSLKKRLPGVAQKRAVTVQMLRAFAQVGVFRTSAAGATGKFHRSLWAAILLAFHALLRGSEYAWKGKASAWTAEEGLCRADVTFLPQEGPEGPAAMGDRYVPKAMQLRIKSSKVDPFKHGCEFVFHATLGPLCVVAAVYASFLDGGAVGTCPGAPLFTGASGYLPLSFQAVTAAIKAAVLLIAFTIPGLRAADFTSHSLRSGGATALLAAGYSIEFVKVMGRWRSDSWRTYAQLDISTTQNIARAMQESVKERPAFHFSELCDDAVAHFRG